MPKYTTNYGLSKPLESDLYDINIQNNNMDVIDTNLKKVSNVADEGNARSKTNESNLEALKSFKEDPFEETSKLVQVDLFQDAPLNVVSHIEPVQAGSGDPYPPGGGKNICPGFENGLAYANDNGNDLANAAYGRTLKIPIKDGVTYVQSNSQGLAVSNVHFWDADGNWISQVKTNDINTRPDGVDAAFMAFVYYRGAGVNLEWVQVEVGTTATEYKPYENIRPITGRTGAKLTRCGKNLLPNTATTQTIAGVTFTVNNDGSITMDGTATTNANFTIFGLGWNDISNVLHFNAAENYILSKGSANAVVYCRDAVNNLNYATPLSESLPITKMSCLTYAMIQVPSGKTVSNETIYPMIRLASVTDATYEPYRGDTFALDFGQTVYGGTLDWNKGELVVDRAMLTLTGGETDIKTNTTMDSERFRFKLPIHNAVHVEASSMVPDIKCSHYTTTTATNSWYNDIFGISQQGGTSEIYVSDANYSANDLAGFKAYLTTQYAAGKPVQVCYKLNSPKVFQLDPNEISALAGLNSVYSDSGDVTVSGRKDIIWLTHSLIKRIEALEAQTAGL